MLKEEVREQAESSFQGGCRVVKRAVPRGISGRPKFDFAGASHVRVDFALVFNVDDDCLLVVTVILSGVCYVGLSRTTLTDQLYRTQTEATTTIRVVSLDQFTAMHFLHYGRVCTASA